MKESMLEIKQVLYINVMVGNIMPWYKYPLVWLVIGLPVVSIMGCMVTIFLAYNGADQPISTQVKRQGMFYHHEQRLDQNAFE